MSYTKQTWASGDVITAAKLNNIENGVEAVSNNFVTPTEGDQNTLLGIEKHYTKGDIIAPEQTISGLTGWQTISNLNTSLYSSSEAIFVEVNGVTTLIYKDHYPYSTIDYIFLDLLEDSIKINTYNTQTYTITIYQAIPSINYTYIEEYDIIINAYISIGYSYIIKMDYDNIRNKLQCKQPIKGAVFLYNEAYHPNFQKYELQSITIEDNFNTFNLHFAFVMSAQGNYNRNDLYIYSADYEICKDENSLIIEDTNWYQSYLSNDGIASINSRKTGRIDSSSGGSITLSLPLDTTVPFLILVAGSTNTEDSASALFYKGTLSILTKGNNVNLSALSQLNGYYRIQITQTTNRGYFARWIALN